MAARYSSTACAIAVAGSKESAGNFDKIARPDQMIAAEIVIALGKPRRIDKLAMMAPEASSRCVARTDVLTR